MMGKEARAWTRVAGRIGSEVVPVLWWWREKPGGLDALGRKSDPQSEMPSNRTQ